MSSMQRRFSIRRASTLPTKKDADTSDKQSRKDRKEPSSASTASTAVNSPTEEHSSGFLKSLKETFEIAKRDLPLMLDPQMISAVLDAKHNINNLDDRKMLLEHALMLIANTPANTELYQKLQSTVVQLLYNDLPHPPPTYLTTKYAWRTADGSLNNVNIPEIGKAGNPYSRSVQQVHPLPSHMLPDPGLVFDSLLKRDKFKKHPAGLSSLMFSFAALVIHTCFRTSHTKWEVNETSSYVDLAPLYGNDQKAQDSVRDKSKGKGLMHPDVFAEDRLLLLPPAVCVLLVLFNRNHNFIASKILDINERGTWVDPDTIPASDPNRAQRLSEQDEAIFQTARLINCGWFANVVLSDYFAAILGFPRQGLSWWLNPFDEIREANHEIFERGRGNAVSVEFNCLYRWHATTSQKDEKWVETIFEKFFEGKKPEEVSPMDFAKGAMKAQSMMPDVEHWTFGGLKRQEDGTFADADLARALMEATATPAAAFGARGTPAIMRLNEVMGIEQSRKWGCCSLNDFRKFLGLKPYASFLEWNPDPEIAEAASRLYYGDINNLELYVGLQAEETKPVMPGAGLCPGYTISRAILADAIALTRGDRFYTADLTPYNYTSWGLADCMRRSDLDGDATGDKDAGAGFGSMLGRLFLRTLPGQYTSDSSYTWFPLMTPDSMKGFLGDLSKTMGHGKVETYEYNFDRPVEAKKVRVVENYAEVQKVLGKRAEFRPVYADRVGAIVKGQGFFIAYDQTEDGFETQREAALSILFPSSPTSSPTSATPVRSFDKCSDTFAAHTSTVVARESYFLSGNTVKTVDIAHVLKMVPTRWVAHHLIGVGLKNEREVDGHESGYGSDGEWTDEELFGMLGGLYDYIFLDEDPEHQMENETKARKSAEAITRVIKTNLKAVHGGRVSIMGKIGSFFTSSNGHANGNIKTAKQECQEFMRKLVGTGKSIDELANSVLSIAVAASAELAQSMINVVNTYLDLHPDKRATISSSSGFHAFVREALRLDPPFAGVFREARSDKIIADVNYGVNERLFLAIAKANRDPSIFPNPSEVDLTRPVDAYIQGDGISQLFGEDFVPEVLSSIMSTLVDDMPNLRRAPGLSGRLKRFRYNANGTEYYQYLDKNMGPTPWATTLIVQYDAPA